MKSCEKIEKLIYLYNSEDSSRREKQCVDEHIVSCDACRILLQEIQASQHLILEHYHPVVDEDIQHSVWLGIQNRLAQQPVETGRSINKIDRIVRWLSLRPLKLVLSTCAVLFVMIHMMIGSNQSSQNISDSSQIVTVASFSPVVEDVADPDVQVLTMETDDPTIQVVWFFDENFEL